ncbi:MAG: hypothetical protein OXN84_10725 [Albidovulum sp.]|nr:hypothetical protein [Albidovulum sp.]
MQHPRRDRGAGDAGVAVAEAGFAEGFPEAESLQGLQADPLAADRARILVLDVDLRRPRRLLRLLRAAGAQLARDPLRIAFQRRIRPGRLIRPDIFISTRWQSSRHFSLGTENPVPRSGRAIWRTLPPTRSELGQTVAVGGLAALHAGFRGLDAHGRRFWREKMKNQSLFCISCPCKRDFAEQRRSILIATGV